MASRAPRKKRKGPGIEVPGLVREQLTELRDGMTEMESIVRELEALVAAETQRLDEAQEDSESAPNPLEAELREKEEMLRQRDSAWKEAEENLRAQIRDLEGRIREREELLSTRDAELEGLKSKLEALRVPAEKEIVFREETASVAGDPDWQLGEGAETSGREKRQVKASKAQPQDEAPEQRTKRSIWDVAGRPAEARKGRGGPESKKSVLASLLAPMKKKG